MAFNEALALNLLKSRLNRLQTDHTLDSYLVARLYAAEGELEGIGITLSNESVDDEMLLVDYAAWQYANRDKSGAMPDWLRLRRRERWLREGAERDDS